MPEVAERVGGEVEPPFDESSGELQLAMAAIGDRGDVGGGDAGVGDPSSDAAEDTGPVLCRAL